MRFRRYRGRGPNTRRAIEACAMRRAVFEEAKRNFENKYGLELKLVNGELVLVSDCRLVRSGKGMLGNTRSVPVPVRLVRKETDGDHAEFHYVPTRRRVADSRMANQPEIIRDMFAVYGKWFDDNDVSNFLCVECGMDIYALGPDNMRYAYKSTASIDFDRNEVLVVVPYVDESEPVVGIEFVPEG